MVELVDKILNAGNLLPWNSLEEVLTFLFHVRTQ